MAKRASSLKKGQKSAMRPASPAAKMCGALSILFGLCSIVTSIFLFCQTNDWYCYNYVNAYGNVKRYCYSKYGSAFSSLCFGLILVAMGFCCLTKKPVEPEVEYAEYTYVSYGGPVAPGRASSRATEQSDMVIADSPAGTTVPGMRTVPGAGAYAGGNAAVGPVGHPALAQRDAEVFACPGIATGAGIDEEADGVDVKAPAPTQGSAFTSKH
jgi:hypothetical protein